MKVHNENLWRSMKVDEMNFEKKMIEIWEGARE
jgi:hypothetical protein